jgi:outer membrane immunogenic protein
MKIFLLGTVALITLAAAAPASAGDLAARSYGKAPAAALGPIFSWTGFYLGGHVGGAFSSTNIFNGLATGNNQNGRLLGGLQAGADYQFAPNWVAGIEGQYSWLGSNDSGILFPGGFIYTNTRPGLGSLTARLGFAFGAALLYVKGGYAWSDNRETLTLAGAPVAFAFDNSHRNGYTVGAGAEYMFTQNWSAKLEYQYYDFGSKRFVAPAAFVPFGGFRNDEHTVKAGVNYHFNWAGPVAARY